MNPASTDTRIYHPADVGTKLGVQQNDGKTHYKARHSTENPPARLSPPPEHVRTELIPAVPREVGAATRRIEAGQLLVPLKPREQVPGEAPAAAVSASPPEPVAPVTDDLLHRVLRGLRLMRGAR